MSVKIRLARGGRKKLARYRLVATDSRNPRDGRYIENLGFYNPQSQPKEFEINVERIGYWLDNGAIVSNTVKTLLKEDRFTEKLEALKAGKDLATLELERVPEKKKKESKSAKAIAREAAEKEAAAAKKAEEKAAAEAKKEEKAEEAAE